MAGLSCSRDSKDDTISQGSLLRVDIQEMLLEQRLHLVEALNEGLSTQTKAIDNLTLQQLALEKEVKLAFRPVRTGTPGSLDCLSFQSGKFVPQCFSDPWNVVGREPSNGSPNVANRNDLPENSTESRKSFEDRAELAVQRFRASICAEHFHHTKAKPGFLNICGCRDVRKFCRDCHKSACNRSGQHPVVWIRQGLKAAALHPYFDVVFSVLILLNAALIGVEVQTSKDSTQQIPELKNLQRCFGLIFTCELILRVHATGRMFWRCPQLRNNLFDMFLLFTFLTDWLETSQTNAGHGRFLQFLRFARILRALRAVRVASYAPEFRKMAYALQHSLLTLFWALLLLFFIIYCFATTLTQVAIDHLNNEALVPKPLPLDESHPWSDHTCHTKTEHERLDSFWGDLPRSIYSLYATIGGGYSWNELAAPLRCVGPMSFYLFILYTAVAIFGVLNVVTSVFVDSAMESTQHFVDIKIGEALHSKRVLITHLRQLFADIDVDQSGEISIEEMEVLMQNTQLSQYLEAIDIRHDEVDLLFHMLDFDGSGSISIDEFCEGCLKLMGQAKSFDVHRMNETMQSMLYFSEKTLAKVADLVTTLNKLGLSADVQHRRTSQFMIKGLAGNGVSDKNMRVSPLDRDRLWSGNSAGSCTGRRSPQDRLWSVDSAASCTGLRSPQAGSPLVSPKSFRAVPGAHVARDGDALSVLNVYRI